MNPVTFLTNNPNINFDSFKLAFQDLDPNKLKIIYDTVRKPTTRTNEEVKPSNSFFGEKLLDNAKNFAITSAMAYGAIKSIGTILKSQEYGASFGEINEEMVGINSLVDIFSQKLTGPKDLLDKIVKIGLTDQIGLYLRQQNGLLNTMNQQVGLTGQLSKDFREEITMANPELLSLGIGFKELVDFSSELIINTGKFTSHNRESLIEVGKISRAYVGTMSDLGKMLPDFEKIGYGMVDTARELEKSGKESIVLGLRSQSVTKSVGENIERINQFGFKNGIEGLSKMVQKSLEFRTNMDASFNVAERVWDLTDSVNLSAEIQSLGGAVSDFMDPFKLSYMATNNVEGIQDALIQLSKGLATYNNEQKRFEVTGVNLRLAREYAQKTGVDMKTLTEGAIAAAEKQQAHNDLLARGLVLNKEQERFLTNISQMKNGEMTIEITSDALKRQLGLNEVVLSKMTETQKDAILKYQDQFKEYNAKDIIKDQATIMQGIGRDVAFLAATARLRGGKAVERAAEVTMYDAGFNKEYGEIIKTKGSKLIDDVNSEVHGALKNTVKTLLPNNKILNNALDDKYLKSRGDEIRYGGINKDKKSVNDLTPEQYEEITASAVAKGMKDHNHVNPVKPKGNTINNYNTSNRRSITSVDN